MNPGGVQFMVIVLVVVGAVEVFIIVTVDVVVPTMEKLKRGPQLKNGAANRALQASLSPYI